MQSLMPSCPPWWPEHKGGVADVQSAPDAGLDTRYGVLHSGAGRMQRHAGARRAPVFHRTIKPVGKGDYAAVFPHVGAPQQRSQ